MDSEGYQDMKRHPISVQMLIKRHLPPEAAKIWSQEDIFDKLNKITHVRLDRERISKLDGLELLGKNVTNLYLQSNFIEKIENLETLDNLSFMALGSNKVKEIKGLTHLSKLAFLDLSNNQINTVHTDELPQSMIILDLRGNPCTDTEQYRYQMIQELPNLKRLDGEDVTREERIQAGCTVSSDDEDEDKEYESDDDDDDEEEDGQIKGIFKHVTSDILQRANEQMRQIMITHSEHMVELDTIRQQTQLDFNKCDSRATSHDVISVQHLESHDTRSHSSGSRSFEIADDHLNNSGSPTPDGHSDSEDSEQEVGSSISPHRPTGSIILSPFGLLPEGTTRPQSSSSGGLGRQGAPLGPIPKS